MSYYPDAERMEMVVSYLRMCDDQGISVYQREIHSVLGLNKNAVWKIIQRLVEDGRIERIQTDDGPAGHKRLIIQLKEWDSLTDEQKERVISILERIAESQEALLKQGMGPVYNINTATININPVPSQTPIVLRNRIDVSENRMRPMETKGNSLESDNIE